jgi:hypothetical protein
MRSQSNNCPTSPCLGTINLVAWQRLDLEREVDEGDEYSVQFIETKENATKARAPSK